MKIHILTDNRVLRPGLLAEHGLSVFIEDTDINILFDTAITNVYRHNAEQMGIDLSNAGCIVFSHGHFDHCGGLRYMPTKNPLPKIYLHADALRKKYAVDPNEKSGYKEIGIPWSLSDKPNIKKSLICTGKKTHIAPGVSLHAEIPIGHFESAPKGFYTGTLENLQEDQMKDEQMLIFEKEDGLLIFLGCSHPGIINCLMHAQSLYPNNKIHTVLAGMHLYKADASHIQSTLSQLKKFDIQTLIPMHCTGLAAICAMQRAFGDKCVPLCAGQSLEI